MKKSIFTAMLLMTVTALFSQGNSGLGFNYQAVVRGVDGFVLPSKSIELRFSLLPGQQATQTSWEEMHNVTTDALGTIGITVGKGVKTGGVAATFKDVNFAAVHYWMKVEIKEGNDFRELSYSALSSVPYAEVATNATGIPAGTLIAFAGDVDKIPAGWLLCDGRDISRSEYADLYDAIGTAWGHGDNATTFNLPDTRGQFLRGVANGSTNDPDKNSRLPLKEGGNSADKVGSSQGDAIRNITGSFNVHGRGTAFTGVSGTFGRTNNDGTASDYGSNDRGSTVVNFDASRTVPTGGENRPKNIYVNYIIKY
ncbi:MAG: tail fiber protein [Dysgonamonadaceae bacterium]|jgi:microcystin-dependent protein|nr:tail fiber protein [Dysgonamonadaceae bacterium]